MSIAEKIVAAILIATGLLFWAPELYLHWPVEPSLSSFDDIVAWVLCAWVISSLLVKIMALFGRRMHRLGNASGYAWMFIFVTQILQGIAAPQDGAQAQMGYSHMETILFFLFFFGWPLFDVSLKFFPQMTMTEDEKIEDEYQIAHDL